MPEYQFSYLPGYTDPYARIYIFIPTRLHSFTCQIINFRTYYATQLYIYIYVHNKQTKEFHMSKYKILYLPNYTASYARTGLITVTLIITAAKKL